MKKIVMPFVLSLFLSTMGCSFYSLGNFIGETVALPVEATLEITSGVLNGFFYGSSDDSDDDTAKTKKYEKKTKTPVNRELKDYKRDEHGNIVW